MIRNKVCILFMGMCLLISLMASGCQPLRRKFTRKKTAQKKDKFIPILEPVDYDSNVITRQQKYYHHYTIYRVWEKELLQRIHAKDTDARIKQSLEQVVVNLEKMSKWITVDKKSRLNDALENYRSLVPVMEKPKAFRNMMSFESKLRKYERIVRNELKPELIFGEKAEGFE